MGLPHCRRTRAAVTTLAALLMLGACTKDGGAGRPTTGSAAGSATAAATARGGESVAGFLQRVLPARASSTVITARGDELAYCAGFGTVDRTFGTRASCRIAYDVMSITKQFTPL